MNNLHDIIYSVKNYSELSMKLSIIGFPVPSKYIFDMCHPDDWKWEAMCVVMNDLVEKDMQDWQVDSLIENALNLK